MKYEPARTTLHWKGKRKHHDLIAKDLFPFQSREEKKRKEKFNSGCRFLESIVATTYVKTLFETDAFDNLTADESHVMP